MFKLLQWLDQWRRGLNPKLPALQAGDLSPGHWGSHWGTRRMVAVNKLLRQMLQVSSPKQILQNCPFTPHSHTVNPVRMQMVSYVHRVLFAFHAKITVPGPATLYSYRSVQMAFNVHLVLFSFHEKIPQTVPGPVTLSTDISIKFIDIIFTVLLLQVL